MNFEEQPLKRIVVSWEGKDLQYCYRRASTYPGSTDYIFHFKTGTKILSYYHTTKRWVHVAYGGQHLPEEFVQALGNLIEKDEGWNESGELLLLAFNGNNILIRTRGFNKKPPMRKPF